jgi:3-oxoacyl-[acyl-carrier protein] reductase
MIDPGLADKVVLISGANHGIGAAAAEAFAAQGAGVFITYYRVACRYTQHELKEAEECGVGGDRLYCAAQQKSAAPLVDRITSRGGCAFAHEVDLGDAGNIPKLFDLCEEKLGPVEVLVNNHTCCIPDTFDPGLITERNDGVRLVSAEGINRHLGVNARAYALMMSEYVQRYLNRKAKWGRIINTSTDAAHAHIANVSYAASKHAIESYSRSAAAELGKYGITVNIVAPGPIQTGYLEPGLVDAITRGTPLGRVGEPADVADVMVFLASEQARWLTGQLIYVGGGWRMHQ